MTKLIPILSGRCLVVELPEGATTPEVHTRSLTFDTPMEVDEWGYDYQSVKLPPGNWRIIGMLSEVTEEDAAKLVDYTGWGGGPDYWQDYTRPKGDCKTAIESLESAILAEGYYLDENPIAVPDFSGGNIRFSETVEYAKAQSRVLDRSRCLLLGRVDG